MSLIVSATGSLSSVDRVSKHALQSCELTVYTQYISEMANKLQQTHMFGLQQQILLQRLNGKSLLDKLWVKMPSFKLGTSFRIHLNGVQLSLFRQRMRLHFRLFMILVIIIVRLQFPVFEFLISESFKTFV